MKYQLIFEKALSKNIECFEVYKATTKSTTVKVYESKLDNYSASDVTGIAFRGIYKGKVGITFLEKYDESKIDSIIAKVIENATMIKSKDQVFFNKEVEKYDILPIYNKELEKIDTITLKNILLDLEIKIKEQDKRIFQIPELTIEIGTSIIEIVNTYGLSIKKASSYAIIFGQVVVKGDQEIKDGFDYQIVRDIKDIDVKKLAVDIVKKAVDHLKPTSIKTGNYDVLIKNEAMISLLGQLSQSFNGDNVNKGISILKDKLNEKVFSDKLTIVDDPLLLKGIAAVECDDEGVKSSTKTIVENGKIISFLHNLKTANVAGVKSTGNGFKSGYATDVNISPTNFYIKSGTLKYNKALENINEGVIITSLSGLHAGMNTLTMDFSLEAEGFTVKNGKREKPISLIILSGNLIDFLDNKLDNICDDLKFSYTGIGAPSIVFKDCKISGE
jgi:PmbA protein